MGAWVALALGVVEVLRWVMTRIDERNRMKVYNAITERVLTQAIQAALDDMRRSESRELRDDEQKDLFRD